MKNPEAVWRLPDFFHLQDKSLMNQNSEDNCSFFCSWSGGKDSCLALYNAVHGKGPARALLTMMTEAGDRSRSHGLPLSLLEAQARLMGIPVVTAAATWDTYEEVFRANLIRFKEEGMEDGVFGDIDLEPHLQWVERVCDLAGITPWEPLWQRPRRDLLAEFFKLGFTAVIVAVKEGVLDESFLGRTLNPAVVADLEAAGVDASGEEGEYHTVVTSGPLFSAPLELVYGKRVLRGGYIFLDVTV